MTDTNEGKGHEPAGSVPQATPARQPSLSEGLAGHHNSFGLLRLALAALVIVSHAFPIGGWGEDPLPAHSHNQENIGGVAVLGFFAISGYLIAKSGLSADGLQFIWRRVLRIFPAFWTVLIAAAFVVGPVSWLISGRALSSYFTFGRGGPFSYVVMNADLMMRQWGVYDLYSSTTPYGRTGAGAVFNGSLWTLSYEWGAYLIVWALVIFGVFRRAKVLILVITGFYLLAEIISVITPGSTGRIIPYFGDTFRISLPLIFLYGACFAVYAGRVPLDSRLAALSAIVAFVSLWQGGLAVVGYPAAAYLVLWLAAALPKSFHWIGAKNDYSYGIYLFGFLVQQFTAFLGWHNWGYIPWTVACLVISAGCAWLSWHGIEKRALQLKDWGPGRGIGYWRGRAPFVWGRNRSSLLE